MQTDNETWHMDGAILAFIGQGMHRPKDEGAFNELALRLFAYQFRRNQVYGRFCIGRGLTPDTVRTWRDIPAVPTQAFKELDLTCFPKGEAIVVYQSSGTTAVTKRSRHYLDSLDLYDASLLANFKACVLTDSDRMPMLILGPTPSMLPNSSLTHMLEVVKNRLGTSDSAFYLDTQGLRIEPLLRALQAAESARVPVCLLGTAFAFVHFLDHCTMHGFRFALARGSRIMDTGGFKGKSREVPKAELHALYAQILGVEQDHIVNEYGMTELGSQYYDSTLAFPGRPRRKVVPPWARVVIVDPETLEPLTAGKPGLIRHYDLANRGSVMAIQTDDLGIAIEEGFEIQGRASGAEARGCSIAIDEMLTHARPS